MKHISCDLSETTYYVQPSLLHGTSNPQEVQWTRTALHKAALNALEIFQNNCLMWKIIIQYYFLAELL